MAAFVGHPPEGARRADAAAQGVVREEFVNQVHERLKFFKLRPVFRFVTATSRIPEIPRNSGRDPPAGRSPRGASESRSQDLRRAGAITTCTGPP